jgi:uncharacterized membrane protein YkvA (DUF1232 family)
MPLTITLQLSDKDLDLFAERMRAAKSKEVAQDEAAVIAAAHALIERIATLGLSEFVRDRMNRLGLLARMLADKEWDLDGDERQRIVSALVYLTDPHDLIPDETPGLGYLDDAILIELVCKELRPEMEAYADFERYRAGETKRFGVNAEVEPATREQWIAARRAQLKDRMRRRRDSLWRTRLGRRSLF